MKRNVSIVSSSHLRPKISIEKNYQSTADPGRARTEIDYLQMLSARPSASLTWDVASVFPLTARVLFPTLLLTHSSFYVLISAEDDREK